MNFLLLLILCCSQKKAFDASKERTDFMVFFKRVIFDYQIIIELHLPNEIK